MVYHYMVESHFFLLFGFVFFCHKKAKLQLITLCLCLWNSTRCHCSPVVPRKATEMQPLPFKFLKVH